MSTIVFGDDGSPAADTSWRWIDDQTWPGWSVDVISIPERFEHAPAVPGGTEVCRPHEPAVRREPSPSSQLESVRHLTADADPRAVLGRSSDADLVVVGPTGRGLLKRWLHLGSTTEWLLHDPPAPVLIARVAGPVRRVMVGVDGSEQARRAVATLASMPWVGETDIHVIGVYDGWADPAAGLEDAVAILEPTGATVLDQQVRGKATATLRSFVDGHEPDLLVLGAKGHSGIGRAIAGSTAAALARGVACNVMLAD